MHRSIAMFLGAGAIALVFAVAVGAQGSAQVTYPEGYRDWTHVKSMVIQQGHPLFATFGGIHHIYANVPALGALRAGKSFPDGSVFVFDLLSADGSSQAITEGPRKILGVMQKDAKRFASTGGWGFEGFKGDTRERAVTDAAKSCYECHTQQKASDYVFTKWRP